MLTGLLPATIVLGAMVTIVNAEMGQRITYQVEQRCRDIEPTAYRKVNS